ncbi:MAG: YihY/virulence factor BrkB family protein [Elusimicrobia bacterium]|nr:YihY/virulence factor BrkB family protein [Elusimicrobiota bacterium]
MKNLVLPAMKAALRQSAADRVPMMGAALAFYAVFSIAPLLVISMSVAGLFFGERGGAEVLDTLGGAAGDHGAQALRSMVEGAASRPFAGRTAAAIGVLTLLIGASSVFAQLQESLNVIWKVAPATDAHWRDTARRRLLTFGMVGGIAALLLASVIVTAVLSAAGRFAGADSGSAAWWPAVNSLVSAAVMTGLFGAVFKYLPDARLPWRAALRGGFWTSLLFAAGQQAIGLYLGRTAVASTYGAAGSLVALLLWVYYSAQIVLFGAEVTRAYVLLEGLRAPPKAVARRAHARTG